MKRDIHKTKWKTKDGVICDRNRWKDVDWTRTDPDIAKDVGVTHQRVWQVRHELGHKPVSLRKNKKYPVMDFRLPNNILGKIWKLPVHTVSYQRRVNGGRRPLFMAKYVDNYPIKYVDLVIDERERAQRYDPATIINQPRP